jgi:H+-translocating NAD(P) transhydrogenase subunit alpha
MNRRRAPLQSREATKVATDAAQADLAVNLLIFVLATFLGTELIRHVSRLLHTPLMALTNAISSVSIVAGLIVLSEPKNDFVLVLVSVAIALAATNIVSGFMITGRILRMFRRKPREEKKKVGEPPAK